MANVQENLGRKYERFVAALVAQGFAHFGRMARWLVAHGCPRSVASGIIWTAAVAILAVLICLATVVALVLQLVSVLPSQDGLVLPKAQDDGEWRQGLQGFGCYKDGVRIDHNRLFEQD